QDCRPSARARRAAGRRGGTPRPSPWPSNLGPAQGYSATATGAAYLPFALLRSEEHTSELQSLRHLVCRLLLEKKKYQHKHNTHTTGFIFNHIFNSDLAQIRKITYQHPLILYHIISDTPQKDRDLR